jgi:hypothetical protein
MITPEQVFLRLNKKKWQMNVKFWKESQTSLYSVLDALLFRGMIKTGRIRWKTVPWLRRLVADLSQPRPGPDPRQVKKGKAVPLQAWSGPECSRKLRYPDYTTTAQDGGKVVKLTHRLPLPPGNAPGTHFC